MLLVFKAQLLSIGVMVSVGALARDAMAVLSALSGGVIACLGGFTYTLIVYHRPSFDPEHIFKRHCFAEFCKFSLTIVLFGLFFLCFRGLPALPLLLTFAAATFCYYVALLVV